MACRSVVMLVGALVGACSPKDNYLGYDVLAAQDDERRVSSPLGDASDGGAGDGGSRARKPTNPAATGRGDVTSPPTALGGPDRTNHFADIGVSDDEADDRIRQTYDQLFTYDPSGDNGEYIYVEVSDEQAYVWDVLHGDTRMDALGHGMFFSVQLDRKDKFDKIWNFTKSHVQVASGPDAGRFADTCHYDGTNCTESVSTFGVFYVITALFFAQERWGNGSGVYDYGAEARTALAAMQDKEGAYALDVVTNVFDDESFLPRRAPRQQYLDETSPGTIIAAFYEVWAQKTGEDFWLSAAREGRDFLYQASHPMTGFIPVAAYFDGTPLTGAARFDEYCYGFGFHIAMDEAWFGGGADSQEVEMADRMIGFFAERYPDAAYPAVYSISGEAQNQGPSRALVSVAGAIAGISTHAARLEFIQDVWDRPTPVGPYRYFDGILHLFSLMYLGGAIAAY